MERHPLTAVAVASGALEPRHSATCHRFFARTQWSLAAVGRGLFTLALPGVPAAQPVYRLLADTLARKHGQCIALAPRHHEPWLSTARQPVLSFGHVGIVLALWVPWPLGDARGFALPVLFRLSVGATRGGERAAPSRPHRGPRYQAAVTAPAPQPRPTKRAWARELIDRGAPWTAGRTVYVVVARAYAARPLREGRPPHVPLLSRRRLAAARWARPPRRRPGQKGRPRRRWIPRPLPLDGRRGCPQVFTRTVLGYHALRDQPRRRVVVRDPTGQRRAAAFCGTDLPVDAAFSLTGYARRWTRAVAFDDQKQFLGFAEPQQQREQAVARTAPFAGLVYALVLLWAAARVQHGRPVGWVPRPWYRTKTAPAFVDLLTALR